MTFVLTPKKGDATKVVDQQYTINPISSDSTEDQKTLNQKYLQYFGRPAHFGTDATKPRGGNYWLETHRKADGTPDWDAIDRGLQGSLEGTKRKADPNNLYIGGIKSGTNLSNVWNDPSANEWLSAWPWDPDSPGAAANHLAALAGLSDAGSGAEYFYNTLVDGGGGGGDDSVTPPPRPGGLTVDDLNDWWETKNQNQGGMDDFMKFMMLLSVMRPGGGGYGGGMGGGYGGSQYGYGGLNPGGVQAAYNPLEQLEGMSDWFNRMFGSGATTGTINTGSQTPTPTQQNPTQDQPGVPQTIQQAYANATAGGQLGPGATYNANA